MGEKIVFLDRDGTLNEEVEYLHRPEDLVLLPGVVEALRLLKTRGFKLVVVTNQAGVARGYYGEEEVACLHEYMNRLLAQENASVDHFFYCPHHPVHGVGSYKKDCHCRKPETGMFEMAEQFYDVDKAHSYMVGDKLLDVEAGRRYGVRSILVGTGYGSGIAQEIPQGKDRDYYDCYAANLVEAAKWILKEEEDYMEGNVYLEELIGRYPILESIKAQIEEAYHVLEDCYSHGGKLLIAGNGGSCADAEHIVGELMKGFVKPRHVSEAFAKKLAEADPERGEELAGKLQGGLPAIALTGHNGLSTAYLNDVDGNLIFAQQTYGYGREGDVLLGISTSGNSKNIMYAMATAKALGMKTIGLTGRDGGLLKHAADVCIVVPEKETFKIQELHLPVYHALCLMLEERFF